MQGCCVGARQGVRSWGSMVQVAVSMRTNRVGAQLLRANHRSPTRAHDRGGESPPKGRGLGKRTHGDGGAEGEGRREGKLRMGSGGGKLSPIKLLSFLLFRFPFFFLEFVLVSFSHV